MSFELFRPINKAANRKDTYNIQSVQKKTGYCSKMIYFNGGMRDKLNLQNFKHIELYTDTKNKLIAIKPTNEKSEYTRSLRKNGYSYYITCTSWFYVAKHDLDYPERGSGTYEVVDDLVILHPPVKENQ